MRDHTRHLELGKMLMDVAKYILTIVVISGIVSDKVNSETIVLGLLLAAGFMGLGFQAIPLERKNLE